MEGDMLEAQQEGGKIVLIPKTLVNKAPVQKLTEHEQNIMITNKEKIAKINNDIIHSRGLNTTEIRVRNIGHFPYFSNKIKQAIWEVSPNYQSFGGFGIKDNALIHPTIKLSYNKSFQSY